MSCSRFPSLASLLQCAVVGGAWQLAACTAHDDVSTEPVASQQLAEVLSGGCIASSAGDGWKNGFMPQQMGKFQTGFELWPNQAPIDAVVGISNGPADAFSDLAASVRLNPDGYVDARNGGSYMADVSFPYRVGTPVNVRLHVDIANRVYDVDAFYWDKEFVVPLARGYRFRTQQSAAVRLDNAAQIVDSTSGSFEACHASTFRVPDSCLRMRAGGGWTSEAFPAQRSRFRVLYQAWVSHPQPDVVYGLSSGPPSRFASLAAILRFNDQGLLDARDANVYRADHGIAYGVDDVFKVIMDVDVTTRTYSVLVSGRNHAGEFVPLATSYRFRSEQAGATSLSHFGSFVDSSVSESSDTSSGDASACFLTIDYP